MRALQFWKAVTMDRSDFLERLLAALEAAKIKFCVIGGVAVNAYAEPVITLDLDVAGALEDGERAENVLSRGSRTGRGPFALPSHLQQRRIRRAARSTRSSPARNSSSGGGEYGTSSAPITWMGVSSSQSNASSWQIGGGAQPAAHVLICGPM